MHYQDQKQPFVTVLKVAQSLSRDAGVWEYVWYVLIDQYLSDKENFYKRISSPLEPFASESINKRIERIELFLAEKIDNIHYDTPLKYPEDVFEDYPFTGEEFLEDVFQNFVRRPKGIEALTHFIVRQMASENTYSYIDDGIAGKQRPHFDNYKEDLQTIPIKEGY